MSEKVDFLKRLEAAKEKLPTGAVPLYLRVFPGNEKNLSRIKNTLSGRIQDDKILNNLEELVKLLERMADQSANAENVKNN